MESLEILVPKEKTISIGGKTITLRPLSFVRIAKLGYFLQRVPGFMDMPAGSPMSLANALLLACADRLPELTELLTGERLEDLTGDEAVELMMACVELNGPLFARILLGFRKASENLDKAMEKIKTQSPAPSEK